MISIGRLEARDRSAWEELFAGYQAFYGRPDWPRENYDEAWRRFQQDDRIHARGARVDGQLGRGSCTVGPRTGSGGTGYCVPSVA